MHHIGHRDYRISAALVSDAGAIARVHVDTWRTTYRDLIPSAFLDSLSYSQREDLWTQVLRGPSGRSIVVAREADGPIIGFALGGPARDRIEGYRGELMALYVREAHQRHGVGSGLVAAVADALVRDGMDSMYAWVLAENSATRFFERLGGHRLNERTIDIAGRSIGEIAYGWPDLVAQVLHRNR